MQGVNLFAVRGLGFDDLSSRLSNIQESAQEQLNHSKERVEAGEIDTAEFQKRLEIRFGEAAEGIVGEDGTIDFEALRAFLEEQGFDRPYGQSDSSGESFDSAAYQQPLIDFQA